MAPVLKQQLKNVNEGSMREVGVFPKALRLLNKNTRVEVGYLVREVPRHPHPQIAIASAVGCTPELDSQSLLLKSPLSLVTEHGEINLGPKWLPGGELPLTVLLTHGPRVSHYQHMVMVVHAGATVALAHGCDQPQSN